jgi:hypothetical protein
VLIERARASGEVCFSEEKVAEFRRHLFYLSGTWKKKDVPEALYPADQMVVPTQEGHKDGVIMAFPKRSHDGEPAAGHGLCRGRWTPRSSWKSLSERPPRRRSSTAS